MSPATVYSPVETTQVAPTIQEALGVDPNKLIGLEFDIQGVRFSGMEECRPCYWMDRAFAAGAQEFLKGRGGLRAKILCDGILRSTARRIEMQSSERAIASPFARERAG